MTVKTCTFCAHRLDNRELEPKERKPFCIGHCPAQARYFGDISDPASEVSQILAKARSHGRTIRNKGAFLAKPGFSKPEPSVVFIAHDLV